MLHYTAIRWLVHRPLMGGVLHLVQRGGAWAGCGPAQLYYLMLHYNYLYTVKCYPVTQKWSVMKIKWLQQKRNTITKGTIGTSSNSSVILRMMSACSILWYMCGVMRPRHPEQWMKNWISSSSAASRSCLYASIHSSTTVWKHNWN